LYTKGNDNNSLGGVGFLIWKDLADNIVSFKNTSPRVAQVVIKLSKRQKMRIIQVYAPTTSHPDEEVEDMYEEINKLLDEENIQHTIVMGDLNAKVGTKAHDQEHPMGKFGIGQRNERGDRLIEFAESRHLKIMNTFFKKKPTRKWTWKSPNGETKNEIDFILSNSQENVKDVTVLSRFNTGSDHRLVRAKVKQNKHEARKSKTGQEKSTKSRCTESPSKSRNISDRTSKPV